MTAVRVQRQEAGPHWGAGWAPDKHIGRRKQSILLWEEEGGTRLRWGRPGWRRAACAARKQGPGDRRRAAAGRRGPPAGRRRGPSRLPPPPPRPRQAGGVRHDLLLPPARVRARGREGRRRAPSAESPDGGVRRSRSSTNGPCGYREAAGAPRSRGEREPMAAQGQRRPMPPMAAPMKAPALRPMRLEALVGREEAFRRRGSACVGHSRCWISPMACHTCRHGWLGECPMIMW